MKQLVSVLVGAAVAFGVGAASAQEMQKVRIGTEGAYLPWNGTDASGQLIGFEIELARDLCARINAECEFVAQDWDGIIPALQTGKYDVIMAAMSITDERSEVIDFTRAYATEPTYFAAMADSDLVGIETLDRLDLTEISPEERESLATLRTALDGKTVGVQVATTHQNFIEQFMSDAVELRTYDKVDSMGLDLVSGRIDAMLADRSAIESFAKSESGSGVTLFGPGLARGMFGRGIGMGLRKSDQELRDKFNQAIEEATADGTITRLSMEWFGFDTSIK